MRTPSAFGIWVREQRQLRGMSQRQLAELASLHRLQIVYLENGRTRAPRLPGRIRLAEALGSPLPEQFTTLKQSRSRCGFCAAPTTGSVFIYVSPRYHSLKICAGCLRAANQAAALEARMRNAAPFRMRG
jgi:transcriptional regulator with XRE-family HTH domain